MTKKGEGWISRRGQAGAATAVELVLEHQPHEPIWQIADELIEDSPYQARQPITDSSVAELVQAMAAAGFQGVLIVRPHGDAVKRRQGYFQLVYGHRRRAAWRRVCQERGEPCVLPVVIRDVSDAQMLTIGAQENLQRQDLDPIEEAQLVAWAERMFFDKNQAEIGALLGKSSDWVSARSRIHKLPEPLKEALRQRPRAIKQMLELAPLYAQNPSAAHDLAHQVVRDSLTVEALRQRIVAWHSVRAISQDREDEHNRRAGATSVQNVTSNRSGTSADPAPPPPTPQPEPEQPDARATPSLAVSSTRQTETAPAVQNQSLATLLQEAAAALAVIAQHRDQLPRDHRTMQALGRIQRDLAVIQQVMADDPVTDAARFT